MEFAFANVSSKGQIVIPKQLRKRLGLKKGKRLVFLVKGKKLLVEPLENVEHLLEDDFSDLLQASGSSTSFWDNEKDEVWNSV